MSLNDIKSGKACDYKEAYQRLIRNRRWGKMRGGFISLHDHCEACGASLNEKRLDVHHIIPISNGKDYGEMMDLAYRAGNLMSLCRKCHCAIHRKLRQSGAARSPTIEDEAAAREVGRRTGKRPSAAAETAKEDNLHAVAPTARQ